MSVATQSLQELENELNTMIQNGQALEAFEKFYADECVMQDQGFEPWKGKELNREREKDFFSKITDFRKGALIKTSVGEDVTMSIWQFDYTHAEWGVMDYEQVAVRHWVDGKIVLERFYRG